MSRTTYYQKGSPSAFGFHMDTKGPGGPVMVFNPKTPRFFGRGWRKFKPHRSQMIPGWATQPPHGSR